MWFVLGRADSWAAGGLDQEGDLGAPELSLNGGLDTPVALRLLSVTYIGSWACGNQGPP